MAGKQGFRTHREAKNTLIPGSGDKESLSGVRKKPFSECSASEKGAASQMKEGKKKLHTRLVSDHAPRKDTRKQLVPKGYTVKPIVPASKAELVSVAKAMHREQFGETLKQLFHPEKEAAVKAIQTGIYIGWRCPENKWDCFRVSDESKCFCGHLLKEHQSYTGQSVRVSCAVTSCKCKAFAFIPGRPEEVGEFWLKKRPGFDATAWRAKCRCKHSCEEHDPTAQHACKAKGCQCWKFESDFLCAACDRHWEDHETFFDTAQSRKENGLPYGEYYMPFAEMPSLRNVVLAGGADDILEHGSIAGRPEVATYPLALPPSFTNPNDSAPVPTSSRKTSFRPVYY